jgi:hypothetical protein
MSAEPVTLTPNMPAASCGRERVTLGGSTGSVRSAGRRGFTKRDSAATRSSTGGCVENIPNQATPFSMHIARTAASTVSSFVARDFSQRGHQSFRIAGECDEPRNESPPSISEAMCVVPSDARP